MFSGMKKENMVCFALRPPLWKSGEMVIGQWSSQASSIDAGETSLSETNPMFMGFDDLGFGWEGEAGHLMFIASEKIRHALMWINLNMRLWALWNQDRTDER